MPIQAISQVLSGITFAKATPENVNVANSPTGGTASSLKDIISPVTLATGKITVSTASTAVTGTATNFLLDFSVGDYLFYYDNLTDEPILLGQIATVSSDLSMTLTANSPVTKGAPGVNCGKTKVILSNQDEIMIRVPVPRLEGNQFALPYWAQWFINPPGEYGSINNLNTNSLTRYSQVNIPSQAATPPLQNLPYSLRAAFGWGRTEVLVNGEKAFVYFATAAQIPNYAYAFLDRTGLSDSVFAPNTLYKLMAKDFFSLNCIKAGLNYSRENLIEAGYIPA